MSPPRSMIFPFKSEDTDARNWLIPTKNAPAGQ
jgi:hypothetical protein